MGFLITAILVVNNLRDVHSDRQAGKRTLAVRLGIRGTRIEFLVCLVGAYLVPLLLWLVSGVSAWILLAGFQRPWPIRLPDLSGCTKGGRSTRRWRARAA